MGVGVGGEGVAIGMGVVAGGLLDAGDGVVDGLGHVVDVLGGQTTHVDAAAGHQVDVLLFDHVLHLLGCERKGRESSLPVPEASMPLRSLKRSTDTKHITMSQGTCLL